MLTMGRVAAGTGCKYLTEQVAPGKDDFAELSPTQALSYYSDTRAHGESPGRWLGRGLGTVGLGGPVSASELENLVGKARHPHFDELLRVEAVRLLNDQSLSNRERQSALATAEKDLHLGRAFATYESAGDQAERAVQELGEGADEASKDAIRAQVLADGDRQAVAAYELTFTPVKSVSVLGVIGGEAMWQEVMDAHRAAADTALEYVQDHAAYSRAGVNGVRQIDTNGLIIAAFEHRMSREQDPNIHTHAIVANRVQCADGKWRTVDGRAVYAASVGARAVYEQALEVELAHRLGVRFSVDERRTIREIHGIPLEVIERFSKRDAAIKKAMADEVDGHIRPGRGWHKLHRVFTLSTRPPKKGTESSADAIARWQRELVQAGHDPDALLDAATHPSERQQRPRTDQQILAEAVAVLNQTRAVWTRHHAVLAISRVLPPEPAEPFADHQVRVEQLVNRLSADSVQVTPPDMLDVGVTLRRASDAQSVFTKHADVLYAARSTVAAEQRILAALEDADAPLIPAPELAASIARVPLGDDQDVAVHAALTSGERISAIVGPAGSGKTYVQRAIVAAWTARRQDDQQPDGRDVLALAPSQIAAAVLADSIGTRAENVAKWLHEHRKQIKAANHPQWRRRRDPDPQWTLRPGQLVIVDEAGMLTTRELDAVLTAVRKAGAKLLLVGDDKQLGAIGAGGMFATIADRTNAPMLSTVRRFRDEQGRLREWECAASLGLRNRELDALAEYERRGRIHSGPLSRMEETSYRAWLTDHLGFQEAFHAAGATSNGQAGVALLMADTEAAAATLSARARADLVRRGIVEPGGSPLADGNRAGVGDLIVTRLNERRIRAEQGEGFVANRDTWRVIDRDRDGSLTVTAVTGEPRQVHLPADYVTANVQLAYAGTVHSAQGRTVTTARGLVTEHTTAQALYVMMSRGQLSNDAYVATDDPEREAHQRWPEQHHLSVLATILERDDQPSASVADVERDLYEQATSIARLRIIFGDLSAVVRGDAYETLITDHAGRDAADQAVTDPAWASLVRALGTAQLLGWDSRQLLIQAITGRELGTAADLAAVLHWRCENITGHWREAPDAPPAGQLSWHDRATGILAAAHGDSLTNPVSADAADALRQVAAAMDTRSSELAHRYAEQAAAGQQGATVPAWLTALGPAPTTGRDVAARREAWLGRAQAVATYQDAGGYQPTSDDPIGPRPPAGDPEARELWNAARSALADAPMAGTMRALYEDRLYQWVADGLRSETAEQPAYVGHELRSISLRHRAQRTRVNRLRQGTTAAAGALGSAERRRWRRDETAIASLTRTHEQITARLGRAESTLQGIELDLRGATRMHQSWQEWEQASRETRLRARLAAQELSIRGLDTEPDPEARPQVAHQHPSAPLVPDMTSTRHRPATPAPRAASSPLAEPRPPTDPRTLTEQYALLAAAAHWFSAHLEQRWAAVYLGHRGLADPAAAARAGYAPSRPGEWTLLLDHLRGLGYSDSAISTAGLAATSARGLLIDRFRDRVVLPVIDEHDRPIGFIGRKPAGDTNPDNPKYLNPTTTPLYDKSRVLYGLDTDAITRLRQGARVIIVEGPMDQLAIRHAAPELVPLATCGTALTDHHLDLLTEHTDLATLTLGFDADTAGRNAALSAGRKLAARGIDALDIDLFTPPLDSDPAEVLADHGPDQLRATLTDPEHHDTLLGLLVEQRLDSYFSYDRPLRELPIRDHAAYDATRLVGEHLRTDRADTEQTAATIQRELTHIADRTGVDPGELNHYLIDYLIDGDYDEYELTDMADVRVSTGPDDQPDEIRLETPEQDLEHNPFAEPDFDLP